MGSVGKPISVNSIKILDKNNNSLPVNKIGKIVVSGRNITTEMGGDGIEIIEVGLRPGEKMYEELLISGDQLPTNNPKIFKSMESFPPFETIESSLQALKTAMMVNDYNQIIEILKKNVEGYNP